MFKSVLVFIVLLSFINHAHAATPEKVAGGRWGTRVIEVHPDQVVVKLMLLSGHCVAAVPGMTYGVAGDLVTVPTTPATVFEVGQDADLWMGDTGPTFKIPACMTADW